MSIIVTTANNMNSSRLNLINIGLSLSLLIGVLAPVTARADEGMQATAGTLSQSSGLGLDQDSLLPPEVVPFDPGTASKLSQNQAQSRAADMSSSSQSAPGLADSTQPSTAPGGMQTSQEFRKAAFDSLYNQGTLPPVNTTLQNPSLQAMQGQQGQLPGSTFNAQGAQPQQTGQSPWMSASGAPQQQTLSGGVAGPRVGNSKLKGVGHALGTASMFGSGIFMGAAMMSRGASPMSMLGLGLFGASALNYGMRNAFRF